jgi:hypothetical protein
MRRTGLTGLEPATSAVTGRCSNRLNYSPKSGRTCRRNLRFARRRACRQIQYRLPRFPASIDCFPPCDGSVGGKDATGQSRTESRWLNEPHLIAAGCEFPALVTLDDYTPSGFDPDDPGADPTQSRRLQNFDHIAGLKIQLHARNEKTTRGVHRTRRGGLEPPTSGFGDLRSTS